MPQQITHQNIFRVLIGRLQPGDLLLLAAAVVGIRNIQSIQANAASLVREQSVTNRLIDELHSQQTSLSEVFSVLARDPDSVDYDRIMSQLDEADRDIDRISAEGAQTAESRLWKRLSSPSMDFSQRGAPAAHRRERRDLRLGGPVPRSRGVRLRGGAADGSGVPQGERGAGADRPPLFPAARQSR